MNTSLIPPVNGSELQTLQPAGNGLCGARIAGKTVCDPRARCERVRSGGVECACVGNGLFVKCHVRPDGHECEQFRFNKGRYIADDGGRDGTSHDGAEALHCAACAPALQHALTSWLASHRSDGPSSAHAALVRAAWTQTVFPSRNGASTFDRTTWMDNVLRRDARDPTRKIAIQLMAGWKA